MSPTKTKTHPTAAAIKIAETLTGDKYGNHLHYRYAVAGKNRTVEELAAWIDAQTNLPELLDACQDLLDTVGDEHSELEHNGAVADFGENLDPKHCPVCARYDWVQRMIDRTRSGKEGQR